MNKERYNALWLQALHEVRGRSASGVYSFEPNIAGAVMQRFRMLCAKENICTRCARETRAGIVCACMQDARVQLNIIRTQHAADLADYRQVHRLAQRSGFEELAELGQDDYFVLLGTFSNEELQPWI